MLWFRFVLLPYWTEDLAVPHAYTSRGGRTRYRRGTDCQVTKKTKAQAAKKRKKLHRKQGSHGHRFVY